VKGEYVGACMVSGFGWTCGLTPISFNDAMKDYIGVIAGKRIRTIGYVFAGNLMSMLEKHYGKKMIDSTVGQMMEIMYHGYKFIIVVYDRGVDQAFTITESY